ncbi:MAG: alpha-ketoacid dehydrogenase subunit beta [Candidatus Omnitrophota bacterium]
MPWTKVAIDNGNARFFSGSADHSRQKRPITYGQALKEALSQALKRDERVFVMGEGVDDTGGIFGSTLDLHKKFSARVFDTPIAENALTGIATGSALSGMRPVLVHMRMDFMLLSFDQILNHAAKVCYMSGGKVSAPLVIRSIIGKGWGSAAQHSQSLQGLFLHMPGIKVVMPTSAYDAKGLLLSSIADDNPVIFIEHRWLYDITDDVPEEEYLIPLGKGVRRKEGKDITVVATSLMVLEAFKAQEQLSAEGIEMEIIDPRTLNPLDEELIADSVKKTGKLIIADTGCQTGGFASEVAARISGKYFEYLKAPIARVCAKDCPIPASFVLENYYYPNSKNIVEAAKKVCSR